MMDIPLTKSQKEIMTEFYAVAPTKVIFNKRQRNQLWNKATRRASDFDFDLLREKCPALEHQIRRSYDEGHNIQSAVFSECVYAQTFADMLNLSTFINCYETDGFIPSTVSALLSSYHLVPRYIYSSEDKSRMLIQAGGHDGIDSALITVVDLMIYTIEFKEPGAKTSEPDLSKYKEDGVLVVTEEWLKRYPQFERMLEEQKGLNFFEVMGNNAHNFSAESIDVAVSNNYTNKKKYADVICTEDTDGYLVMLPTNQASVWAQTEGEIRPAGRNHYAVWTPKALNRFLLEKHAVIENNMVTIEKSKLDQRRARGGNRQITGYKINPLFFVYVKNCVDDGENITFDLSNVQQLNPTIAAKMFFRNLKHQNVKNHYNL